MAEPEGGEGGGLRKHLPVYGALAAIVVGYILWKGSGGAGGATYAAGPSDATVQASIAANRDITIAGLQARLQAVQSWLSFRQAQTNTAATLNVATLEQELGLHQADVAASISKNQTDAAVAIAQAGESAQVQSAQINAAATEQKNSQNFFGNLVSTVLPFFHF